MKVSLIRRPARQTLFLLEVENNTNITLVTSVSTEQTAKTAGLAVCCLLFAVCCLLSAIARLALPAMKNDK
jgi:hypothetical protein